MNNYTYDAVVCFLHSLQHEVKKKGFEQWLEKELNPKKRKIENRHSKKGAMHY
jgi:hypothetical protein